MGPTNQMPEICNRLLSVSNTIHVYCTARLGKSSDRLIHTAQTIKRKLLSTLVTQTSLIEATAQIVVVAFSALSSNMQMKSLFRPLSCLNSTSALGIV